MEHYTALEITRTGNTSNSLQLVQSSFFGGQNTTLQIHLFSLLMTVRSGPGGQILDLMFL